MPSLLQLHTEQWRSCERCSLHLTRKNVVIYRGKMPCDLLFIGEGPGKSENAQGRPFIGEAGHLLDAIIADSVPTDIRYALTNLVGCLPLENEDGRRTPTDESIKACGPRLVDFTEIAAPKLIVCVGKLATHWLDPYLKESIKIPTIPRVDITHPSAILQAPTIQQGMMRRRCIIAIRDGILKHIGEQS